MITRAMTVRLLLFVVLTVVGVTFAGARYVGWGGGEYTVAADFADSGGIFEGAEVTYRGVSVGRVGVLEPTEDGVRVELRLNEGVRVPADTLAVVANRSAVGEQYVDLRPRSGEGPFLAAGQTIPRANTQTPLPLTRLLRDLDQLVASVPKRDLAVVLDELGKAFSGTGDDLSRLIDNGNLLIEAAHDDLDETIGLIENGRTVLETQRDSGSAITGFAADLADLSEAVAESDEDLRTVMDEGAATAAQVHALVEENRSDVPVLLGNLVTTGQIVEARVEGLQHVLILYPYVIRGGYTVVDKDPVTGKYTAHFGLQLALTPRSCREGYGGTEQRTPADTGSVPLNDEVDCEDDATTARQARNAPEPAPEGTFEPGRDPSGEPGAGKGSGDDADGPAEGSRPDEQAREYAAGYDPATGEVRLPDGGTARIGSLGGQSKTLGKDSWKWLLIGPLTR